MKTQLSKLNWETSCPLLKLFATVVVKHTDSKHMDDVPVYLKVWDIRCTWYIKVNKAAEEICMLQATPMQLSGPKLMHDLKDLFEASETARWSDWGWNYPTLWWWICRSGWKVHKGAQHTGQVSPAVVMQSGVSLLLGVNVGTAKGCRCSQSKILFGIQGLPPMHTHSSLSPHQIYYWDNYPPNWAEGSDGRLLYASFCAKLTVAVGLSQLPPVPLGFALQIYSSGKKNKIKIPQERLFSWCLWVEGGQDLPFWELHKRRSM